VHSSISSNYSSTVDRPGASSTVDGALVATTAMLLPVVLPRYPQLPGASLWLWPAGTRVLQPAWSRMLSVVTAASRCGRT